MTTPHTREITLPQYEVAVRYSREGFAVSFIYADGIIRLDRELANGDRLFTFVHPDGTHRIPRCWEQHLAAVLSAPYDKLLGNEQQEAA